VTAKRAKIPCLVIRWDTDDVTAFDVKGRQLPELQGRYAEVRAKVLNAAGPETAFRRGAWQGRELTTVSREEW